MALYAIADLHLSLGTQKNMDVFKGVWEGYVQKIKTNFEGVLTPEDTLVIAGDFSWGMTLSEALPDFGFLNDFPGKKILVKGNHDFWWDTVRKMKGFLAENSLMTIDFLHNNYFAYRDIALCGSRGWFFEEQKGAEHDRKMINRECLRLRASLSAAKAQGFDRLYVFLHYPPLFYNYRCGDIINILREYNVKHCFYGHLHGSAHAMAVQGTHDGICYRLISADFLRFEPLLLER